MPHSMLIFGCGYLGERVAALASEAGSVVHVVTRSETNAVRFRKRGWLPIVADLTDADSLGELPAADTVLIAVGYDRRSEQTIEQVYVGGVQNVIAALPRSVGRLIYISTTGVYGDAGGEWIDERTPTKPSRAGGKASLAAEQLIAASPLSNRCVLLRLAGIYGPNRLPYLAQLRAGEAIEAPQSGYLNLIHVDDAARVVTALSNPVHPIDGPLTYCVSDGHPVVRGDYYREVARQLGTLPPRFALPLPDSPRAARAAANKRVSNQQLLQNVGVELLCPDYQQGIARSLGRESAG